MKIINYINAVFVIAATLLLSCKKDVPAGGTAMEKMAGDWYVTVDGEEDYFSLYTFNTSDNSSTQLWIQSNGLRAETGPIGVKGKLSADLNGQRFSGTNVTNISSVTSGTIKTFSVANGKVVTNGTVGPESKTPADLISFDLIIDGHTYKVEGYHKTGFLEDIP